jgi:HNH endonuclease/NUMOD4 motif-containing protein
MENWKPIAGYEGLYAISDMGYVLSYYCYRTNQGGMLKSKRHPEGYRSVNLYNNDGMKTKLVHHLVAHAFHGPRPEGYVINHKNGNKADNRATNIEYTTQSENVRHAHRLKLIPRSGAKGEANGRSKLTLVQVVAIRQERAMYKIPDLAKRYNVSISTIERVIDGR